MDHRARVDTASHRPDGTPGDRDGGRPAPTAEQVRGNLLEFLGRRAKSEWDPEQDLFASGSFSSLFALELVMHLESAFGIAIGAEDLRLEHFRTVGAMTDLVLRIRARG